MIAEGRAPTVLWALCQGCHVAQRSGDICSRLVKRAQKVLELLLSVGRLTDPLSFPVRQVLVQYVHCFCLLVYSDRCLGRPVGDTLGSVHCC